MLQGISDATNIGIYHAVTTKISKQKKNSNISNNDNSNNNNNKNKSNNFNINSIENTKIVHHLFLNSKSAPEVCQIILECLKKTKEINIKEWNTTSKQ